MFGMKMAAVGGEIGCLTLGIVLVAVFGGIWLDRIFGTKPIFIILLVLGSAPLSLALTYWIATRATKNLRLPRSVKKTNTNIEEETGE